MKEESTKVVNYGEISRLLSNKRLTTYFQGNSTEEAFQRYLINIELIQSLYFSLSFLEVVLRNSLHSVLSKKFEDELWFSIVLS